MSNTNHQALTASHFPIISKYYWVYFLISLVCLLPGIFSMVVFRFRPGIDFVGGTIIEFTAKSTSGGEIDRNEIASLLSAQTVMEFQKTPDKTYSLKLPAMSDSQRTEVGATLSAKLQEYKEKSLTSVGPVIGKELIFKTITAIGIASVLILLYLAFRFKSLKLGVSAVLATLHDVVIVLGVFSLLGHFLHVEIDLLFVTALLTIVSFSVHDTVVVYDRIRERKKRIKEPFLETIDAGVLETLTRSMRNAGAVLIMLLCLFLLGGETLRWFALALMIGTISGTYSSTFVALPLLVLWERWRIISKV